MSTSDGKLGLIPDGMDGIPLISGTESGAWTAIAPGIGGTLTIALYFMMLIFFGLMTTFIQTTRGFGVGIFYMLLLVLAMVIWFIESQNPSTRGVAIIDLGPTSTWVISVPIGISLGIFFALFLQYSLGAFLPFETIAIFGIPVELIIKIIAPVIAIPIAEEAFFGGVLTPTLSESLGIIPAAIMVGIVWDLWHLGTYNSDVGILVALLVFRIVATFVILYTKSLMPTIIAHILINFMGTFFTIG